MHFLLLHYSILIFLQMLEYSAHAWPCIYIYFHFLVYVCILNKCISYISTYLSIKLNWPFYAIYVYIGNISSYRKFLLLFLSNNFYSLSFFLQFHWLLKKIGSKNYKGNKDFEEILFISELARFEPTPLLKSSCFAILA